MKLNIINEKQVLEAIKQHAQTVIYEVADKLFQEGIKTIQEARSDAKFNNWTNNLRSSLGVAVSINGEIIKSDFELVGNGAEGDGTEGLEKAKKLINNETEKFKDKILLILVAGEEYAFYVEGIHNKSVLTTFGMRLIKGLKSR